MAMGKSPWVWIVLVLSGLVAGVLGVVFIVLDLAQADQLASVIGVFVGLAGLGVSVYGVVLARRGAVPSPTPPQAAARPASITGAGETRNTIEGGTFHGTVIQARDITGRGLEPMKRLLA
ncbi:hypothetical protein [Nonomuraea insulae]|uniref:Uncharacterized protein n=1 Tax=Nonomuraea insulae TaxID=1616787 RepID=A0ABW1CBH6_9ACTN